MLSKWQLSNGGGGGGADSKGNDDEGAQGGEGSGSVAAVVETLTELASLQTPASVWLPNKRLTMQATGKVRQRAVHGRGAGAK